MKAAVSEHRLATVLAERSFSRDSGIVRATRGKLRRVFCLLEGDLVYAASNVIEEQFDRFLVNRKALTPEQRDLSSGEATRTGRKLIRVLRQDRILSEESLRREMGEFVQHLLFSTLEWPDGAHEFEAGRPNLEGEITIRLSLALLVLKHAGSYPRSLEAVRTGIGPPNLVLRRAEDRATRLAGLECGPLVAHLLDRQQGTLADFLTGAPGTEEEALRAVNGLILLGVFLPSRESTTSVPTVKDAPLSRDECLAVLARAEGGDSYRVLALPRTTTADDMRTAYYALARRYHPDRFRAGPLQDLLPKMEDYFAKVTEAYNTLSNAALRAEYDRSLAKGTTGEPKASDSSQLARQNYLHGKALAEKKRYADATSFLENAVRLDPMYAAYHLELGLLLANHPRRRADAERALIRAAELEPTSVESYLALGQMYERAGHAAHAARMYREVLRWEADHAEAQALLAGIGKAASAQEVAFLETVLKG